MREVESRGGERLRKGEQDVEEKSLASRGFPMKPQSKEYRRNVATCGYPQ